MLKFAVACIFAVVHQTEVPVDEMQRRARAQADDLETCDEACLESLMCPPRSLTQTCTGHFAALRAAYAEEPAPDLSGFAPLFVGNEACAALDGGCLQALVDFLTSLQQAHATVHAALAQAVSACELDVHFSPHTGERVTYARLREVFLAAASAAVGREHQAWASTVQHANAVQRAARRTMLIWQGAFERPLNPLTICDEPEPIFFVLDSIPSWRSHHHKAAVSDLLARYVQRPTHGQAARACKACELYVHAHADAGVACRRYIWMPILYPGGAQDTGAREERLHELRRFYERNCGCAATGRRLLEPRVLYAEAAGALGLPEQ
jgi:hypothetical protein